MDSKTLGEGMTHNQSESWQRDHGIPAQQPAVSTETPKQAAPQSPSRHTPWNQFKRRLLFAVLKRHR